MPKSSPKSSQGHAPGPAPRPAARPGRRRRSAGPAAVSSPYASELDDPAVVARLREQLYHLVDRAWRQHVDEEIKARKARAAHRRPASADPDPQP